MFSLNIMGLDENRSNGQLSRGMQQRSNTDLTVLPCTGDDSCGDTHLQLTGTDDTEGNCDSHLQHCKVQLVNARQFIPYFNSSHID